MLHIPRDRPSRMLFKISENAQRQRTYASAVTPHEVIYFILQNLVSNETPLG